MSATTLNGDAPLLVREPSYVCRFEQDYRPGFRPGEIIMVNDPRTFQVVVPYREWWEPIEDEE